jgi:hypothetical protein
MRLKRWLFINIGTALGFVFLWSAGLAPSPNTWFLGIWTGGMVMSAAYELCLIPQQSASINDGEMYGRVRGAGR